MVSANGVPATVTSIPLVDPHALSADPSIGELVKDATAQVSTLVRAEVELARAEITRDVKKGMTGSIFFILAGVVLLYSTFFFFFFLAELLDSWIWRWAAFLIVFVGMLLGAAVLGLLGWRKVRRIRGPQQTIETVKETRSAFTGHDRGHARIATTPHPPPARHSRPTRRGGDVRVTPRLSARPDPSVTRIVGPWRHLDIHANGIRFHVVEANPPAGDRTPGHHPTAGHPAARVRFVLVVVAPSAARPVRGPCGGRRPARLRRQRQTAPRLRRVDVGR